MAARRDYSQQGQSHAPPHTHTPVAQHSQQSHGVSQAQFTLADVAAGTDHAAKPGVNSAPKSNAFNMADLSVQMK